jgi:hypothetical protein
MPDGRARRSQLQKKHREPPLYEQLVGPVMELFQRCKHLGEIAVELCCDRNTVTKVVRFYHESRGLPVPDGRTRRKTLPRKDDDLTDAN